MVNSGDTFNSESFVPKESVNFSEFSQLELCNDFSCLPQNFSSNYKLKRVVAAFRHGHRTPMLNSKAQGTRKELFDETFFKHFKGDCFGKKESFLYKNVDLEITDDLGLQFDNSINTNAVLTDLGAEQLFEVGKQFGSRYGDFLKEQLLTKDGDLYNAIYTIATPFERTVESLQCLLNGLVGSIQFEASPKVKINVERDLANTYFYLPFNKHPVLKQALLFSHSPPAQAKFIEGYAKWAKYVENKSGISTEALDIHHIRDYLTAFWTFDMMEHCDYLSKEDLDKSERFCSYTVALESLLVEDGLRISWAPFMQEVLRLLTTDSDHKLCLLSGHDTTMQLIRLALRAHDYTWPDFGYNIEFELYEHVESEELYILVLFEIKPVILKYISKNGRALIPLRDFVDFIAAHF